MQWLQRKSIVLNEFKSIFVLFLVFGIFVILIFPLDQFVLLYPLYIALTLFAWLLCWCVLLKPQPSRAILLTNRRQWLAWKCNKIWQNFKVLVFGLCTVLAGLNVVFQLLYWLR